MKLRPTSLAALLLLNGSLAALGADSPTDAKPAEFKWGTGIRTLITGGGSSHDYPRWFGKADTATLSEGGLASVNYTEDISAVPTGLKDADVLLLTHNKPTPEPARKAIMAHAAAGKGVVLLHAGLWYNWNDWPDFNRVVAGGGSRGHNRFGEFEVKLGAAKHPVIDGLPASFKITDELYWFEPDPAGTPIDVLATAHSTQKDKTYPMIFIVKHPKARIVGITLGHDGKAHELPEFKRLLRQAVQWTSGKP